MSKVKHVVKLTGAKIASGAFVPLNTQQAAEVTHFIGVAGDHPSYFRVRKIADGFELQTPKGIYPLAKHNTLNYWVPMTTRANGFKIQVSIKKLVGELRYWA